MRCGWWRVGLVLFAVAPGDELPLRLVRGKHQRPGCRVRDVVMLAGVVVDSVLAAACGAAFEPAELFQQPSVVEQFAGARHHEREHVLIDL